MSVQGHDDEGGQSNLVFTISVLAATLLASVVAISFVKSRFDRGQIEESAIMAEIVE
jgi:hypothetical protein